MAIFTDSKENTRSSYPVDAIDVHDFSRFVPIISADQVRNIYLFGIPLYSRERDPTTGKAQVMTDDIINEYILQAIAEVESEINGVDILPVQRQERMQFDRAELAKNGHFKTNFAPIVSVENLSIASGQVDATTGLPSYIYTLPNVWIDTAYFNKGLIYFTPLLPASPIGLGSSVIGTSGAAAFLSYVWDNNWTPAMWSLTYTTGFKDGLVPRIINEIIGSTVAKNILALLAPTHRYNSSSLSMDGKSQSVSTLGPQIYSLRIEQLEAKIAKLLGKVKLAFGRKFMTSNL